jgi:predicted PurR-regulated permease PerM
MTESEVPKNTDIVKIETEIEPEEAKSNQGTIAIIVISIILIAIIAGIIVLSLSEPGTVTKVRDLFIILMALMTFVIGLALVVLIVQIADLTNLLKNEIKPILNSTTDTVNTLKGTVRFMSDNLTEPVIKLNESLAGFKKIIQLFNFKK